MSSSIDYRLALDKTAAGLEAIWIFSRRQNQHARAVTWAKGALALFQAVEDRKGEMQSADVLGSAEMQLGHHEAARAWYTEAERLARELGHDGQLANPAQNLGVLLQEQALELPEEAEAARRRLLGEAAASVSKSLAIHRKRSNEARAAASLAQLGKIHRLLGALNDAELCAHEALAFYEPRDLPDVWKVYSNLEDIAAARGHTEEAAAWRAEKDAKRAELDRLAQGDAPPRLPPQARDAFLALCRVLHAARTANQPLPPDAAKTITDLTTQPDPLGAAGRFLQAIADGGHPSVPEALPPELADIFTALLDALRGGKG
jgi:tetratricopeptide (TPR) repeat protein